MSDIISIERSVSESFVALEATILTVRVTIGRPHEGFVLKGESHVLPKIETVVRGDTLFVKPSEGVSFSTNAGIELTFSVPGLERASAFAGAQIHLTCVNNAELDLKALSGGQIKAEGRAEAVTAVAESGGSINLSKLSARSVSSQGRSGGRIVS